MSSPTLEEDSLSYCLEMHGGIDDHKEAPTNQLDRALLEPWSTAAQLGAVEALSRQVQGLLSRRLAKGRQKTANDAREDDDDGFEFTDELAGLTPSLLSYVSPDSSEPAQHNLPFVADRNVKSSDFNARTKTLLQLTKPLEEYQRDSSSRFSSVGANKYRLSFVDISDSGSEEEDRWSVSRSGGVWHNIEPPTENGAERAEESEEELVGFGKSGVAVGKSGNQTFVGLESMRSVFEGQCGDLQYDDEEISRETHTPTPTSNSLSQPTAYSHSHTNGSSHPTLNLCTIPHHYINTNHRTPERNSLGYGGNEGLDLSLVTLPGTPMKKVSGTTSSFTDKGPRKEPVKGDLTKAITTVVPSKESRTTTQQSKPQGVRCMDHASFSPLYTMSVTQLEHIVRLLETKLQVSSSSLISLLEEKESLTAENDLLNQNISRIARRMQQLFEAQHT
jgi:hypothetical protein